MTPLDVSAIKSNISGRIRRSVRRFDLGARIRAGTNTADARDATMHQVLASSHRSGLPPLKRDRGVGIMKVRYRRSSRHAVRGPDRGGSALFQGRWNRALRLLLRKLNAHSRSANSLSASQLSTEGALQRTVSKPGVGRADVAFKLTEAKMIIPKYTLDDFKKLPLRAIVAFVRAMCAPSRKPRHPSRRPSRARELPFGRNRRHRVCRGFRARLALHGVRIRDPRHRGEPGSHEGRARARKRDRRSPPGGLYGGGRASCSRPSGRTGGTTHARSSHQVVRPPGRPLGRARRLDAFTAAVEASDATGYPDDFISGAVGDYEKLLSLNLGSYPRAGRPIDPSPRGPLGPLWPGQPQSFGQAVTSP